MALPEWIRKRAPAPHRLSVRLRGSALPPVAALAAFCGSGEGAGAAEGGEDWLRCTPSGGSDAVLVFRPEEAGPAVDGFPHELTVESGGARRCFLAAYFTARRLGGVVWVQKRAQAFASAAFAEHYLGDEDVEGRWDRAIGLTP